MARILGRVGSGLSRTLGLTVGSGGGGGGGGRDLDTSDKAPVAWHGGELHQDRTGQVTRHKVESGRY